MALLDLIGSALLRKNKDFDPNDPKSRPYKEKKTSFGRFFSGLTRADPEKLNLDYALKESRAARDFENRRALQTDAQNWQRERMEEGQKHDWNLLSSRLSNEAILRKLGLDADKEYRDASLAEQHSRYANAQAQDLFENTGTWDPIEQQDILKQLRQARLTEPRSLGPKAFYDPLKRTVMQLREGGYDMSTGEKRPDTWSPIDTGDSVSTGGDGGKMQLTDEDRAALLGGGGAATPPSKEGLASKILQTLTKVGQFLDPSTMEFGRNGSTRQVLVDLLKRRKAANTVPLTPQTQTPEGLFEDPNYNPQAGFSSKLLNRYGEYSPDEAESVTPSRASEGNRFLPDWLLRPRKLY